MKRRRILALLSVLLLAMAFPLGINTADAGPGITNPCPPDQICPEGAGFGTWFANSPAGFRTYMGVTYNTGAPLRKFVDSLPGLGYPNRNNLGQYIPVAVPDTTTYSGADYYVIGLKDYTVKMHSDLPKATKIRGYYQINAGDTPDSTVQNVTQYLGPLILVKENRPVRLLFENHLGVGTAGDLFIPVDTTVMGAGIGPLGASCGNYAYGCNYTQNRAVVHLHGGNTPWISDGTPRQWVAPVGEYTTPYLRGESQRNVPDMPDPGQGKATYYWTNQQSRRLMFYHDHAYGITRLNVYAGMAAGYLIWDDYEEDLISGTNTTGINPSLKKVLPDLGGVYHFGIPLVIEDKTFVPWDIAIQDSKWNMTKWGQPGDLWFPHVYEPNQLPNDPTGANPFGRWDYGPWFWPPVTVDAAHSTLPEPSIVPEAFMDTPTVNGTAYPYLDVEPKAYRFQILNASNDRTISLSLFVAEPLHISVTNGGTNYSATPTVTITGGGCGPASATATVHDHEIIGITVTNPGTCTSRPTVSITDSTGAGATAVAAVNTEIKMVPANPPGTGGSTLPLCSTTTVTNDAGLAIGAVDGSGLPLNGTGLPANCWPTTWPVDGRDGGVPDPTTAGPAIIQIGNEGGFLPKPVVIPPTPVGYDYNRRNVVVLNVLNKPVLLGPAERADIIVDFSDFAGKTLIFYNDAPAPIPGFDPRYDYYTDDPDFSTSGGAPTTLPGYGPNTRTMMQFRVGTSVTTPAAVDIPDLQAALAAAFAASQPPMHVPEPVYPAPNNALTETYANIQDYFLTFNPLNLSSVGARQPQALRSITVTQGGSGYSAPTITFTPPCGGAAATATVSGGVITGITLTNPGQCSSVPDVNITGSGSGAAAVANFEPVTIPLQSKAIQELWDPYGRMNATLGVELPFTNNNIQTTIPLGYIDPTTEIVPEGQTQFWKITHNGVDTHPVHVHLYNLQIINRVGWDGAKRPPEDNELGWKETVRMNPLEDIIVALQPNTMSLPFTVPDSVRSEDTTSPASAMITVLNPFGVPGGGQVGNPITLPNTPQFFGWEYVWHCHILGHEENDFMRPFVMLVPTAVPAAPTGLTAAVVTPTLPATSGNSVQLDWTDNNALDPQAVDRNAEIAFRIERDSGSGFVPIATVYAGMPSFTDTLVEQGHVYSYQVYAYNAHGDSAVAGPVSVTMPTWIKATGVNLSGNPASPVFAGTSVLFTATGIGSTVPYQYRFWLDGAVVKDYPVSGNQWTMPASTPAGTHTISVDVRTDLSSPTPDASASLTYEVQLPPAAGDTVRILPSGSIVPTGTYSLISAAFAAAAPDDTVQAMGITFNDPIVNFTTAGTVNFSGGYDPIFGPNPPYMTTLQGTLTVAGAGGTLIVDRLIIQ